MAKGSSRRASAADSENYQGRRRLPQLPGRRYASVVGVAVAAAVLVAAMAGIALPDHHSASTQALAVMDPLYKADQDKRDNDRPGTETVLQQAGADYWTLPVDPGSCGFRVTAPFGWRTDPYPEMHPGMDLACPGCETYGVPFYAAHSGEVTQAVNTYYTTGDASGYGNHVRIYTGIDSSGNPIENVYGHAKDVVVKIGDKVKAGQLLGHIGYTGDVYPQDCSGSHLHFEVNITSATNFEFLGAHDEIPDPANGHLDPQPYLIQHGVDVDNFKAAAAGDPVPVDATDGQALPSSSANPTASGDASPSPTATAKPR